MEAAYAEGARPLDDRRRRHYMKTQNPSQSGKSMRVLIAAAMGLAFAFGVAAPSAGEAQAAPRHAKKVKPKPQHRHARPRHYQSPGRSDYYEHWADKLPVGSSRWFEQMEREGRFGRQESP